jgi:flagellum-specific peptidoglycan hydrolase FlgJ
MEALQVAKGQAVAARRALWAGTRISAALRRYRSLSGGCLLVLAFAILLSPRGSTALAQGYGFAIGDTVQGVSVRVERGEIRAIVRQDAASLPNPGASETGSTGESAPPTPDGAVAALDLGLGLDLIEIGSEPEADVVQVAEKGPGEPGSERNAVAADQSAPEKSAPQPVPDRDAQAQGDAGAREPLTLASSIEAGPAVVPPEPELPAPTGATQQQARFILAAAEAARESQHNTGVPASVTIAQSILESNWGGSRLSVENNNYFGIKAKSQQGTAGVVWYDTWEVIGGANLVQREPFRAYERMADSFTDHGWFFHQNPRYAGALAARDDPKQFAREINRAGYATDPAYAPKLIGLMDRFNLYAFDE